MAKSAIKNKRAKILVIGIDGATWEIIDPLLEKGELPNIKNLIDRGVRATLQSLDIPASPRVWTSIASGKVAEKHGIMGFYSNITQLKCKRIWDILSENGEKVGVFYWFLTWPPNKKINGFIVPGILARDNDTVPEQLNFIKDFELREKRKWQNSQKKYWGMLKDLASGFKLLKYGVSISTFYGALSFKLRNFVHRYNELELYYQIQQVKLKFHVDIFAKLMRMEKPDFAAILLPQADQISHKYWAFYEPDEFYKNTGENVSRRDIKKFGNVIPTIYRKLDESVGKILKKIGDEYNVIVVSDHGFGVIGELFSQLKIKSSELLKKFGIDDIADGISIGPHYIIQFKNDISAERIEEIKARLTQIRFVEDNQPLFEIEDSQNEIRISLKKFYNISQKASIEIFQKHIHINGTVVKAEDLFVHRLDITGDHKRNGILVMAGEEVKAGKTIDDASVLDITPTILYWKGLPLAEDMDGKPILEAFEKRFVEGYEPQHVKSYDSDFVQRKDESYDYGMNSEIEDRLKKLGYIN